MAASYPARPCGASLACIGCPFASGSGKQPCSRDHCVALITPMREDGAVDEAAFRGFVDWQIGEGTDGIVPVGTTGESPTLEP